MVGVGSSTIVSASRRSWDWSSAHIDLVLLVSASILLAVPFLVLSHVNTIDGPAHVLGGRLLESLRTAPVVRHYYDISFSAAPNILVQLLLAAAMTVVSPTWAEKLIVVVYIVAFPLSVRFAIRSVDPSARWLALVSLPFVVSYMFLLGFYDFSYAMMGALLSIGMAIRFRGHWTPRRVCALALMLVLTYASHVVPVVMAVVVIATMTVVDAVDAWRQQRARAGRVVRHVVVPPLLTALPTVGLILAFVASGDGGGLAMQRKGLTSLVAGLATLTLPTVSYSNFEIVAALAVVGVLVVLFVLAVLDFTRQRPSTLTIGLALATVVCVVVYFAAPDELGTGSYLNDRLSLFPPLIVLLALTSAPRRAGIWRAAGIVGLVAALVAAGARLPTQVHYDNMVSEYLTVERAIVPGKTLVALRYSVFSPPIGSRRYKQSDPLAHEASRVAADRGDVDLRHLEAQFAYYPDRFWQSAEQLGQRYLNDSQVPPQVDLARYNADSGSPVEYVLVVGLNSATQQVRNDPATLAVERVLATHYERVMVTRPSGLVTLYRYR